MRQSFFLSALYLYLFTILIFNIQAAQAQATQGTVNDGNFASNAQWGANSAVTYDFIIIGAGAAGPILAANLSSENGWTVLLLEAGGTSSVALGGTDYVATEFKKDPVTGAVTRNGYYTRIDVPAFTPSILNPAVYYEYNWNISNAANGKTLGGSQAHNAMWWTHPTPFDIQRWNVTGWSYNQFFPYIKQVENFTNSGFPITSNVGTSGPVQIRKTVVISPADMTFVNACIADGIPLNSNFGPVVGANYFAQNIGLDGVRQTNALVQLAPLLNSSTLTISIHSQAARVLFKNASASGLRTASGVHFVVTVNGQQVKRTAFARKEVIISAGGLLTPQLLMLSGIGPCAQLEKYNIPPVVINENVGQNIRNHLTYAMSYAGPNVTYPNLNDWSSEEINYGLTGNGLLATAAEVGAAFANIKTSSSLTDPDITLFLDTLTNDPYGKGIGVSVATTQPDYHFGNITLGSGNPLAAPVFNLNLQYVDQTDINSISNGVLAVRAILNQSVAVPIFGAETFPGPSVKTFAQIAASVRQNLGIAYHYYGSAKMGNSGDPLRVVDPNLVVVGTSNLRVIDSSIIPERTFFGIQAVVSGIAQYGTQIVNSAWKSN